MVVGCPKCQTKLKIPDEKIKPEGSKFKCPKCGVILNVRPPASKPSAAPVAAPPAAPQPAPVQAAPKTYGARTAIVAHENQLVAQKLVNALKSLGYAVMNVQDGVQSLVGALKIKPVVVFVDPALPKINGYELARRLKERQELDNIRVVLISSTHDPRRIRRPLNTAPEVDSYIDEDEIALSIEAVLRNALAERKPAAPIAPQMPRMAAPPPAAAATPASPAEDERVVKARRLARTVFSDIALYNPEKVSDAIRTGTFAHLFENEIKEGLKHYNNRVAEDVRKQKDYFQEAMEDFIAARKRSFEDA